jgi:hypothetical protein
VSTPPRHASGRHSKPPSKFATTCDDAIRSFSAGKRRRQLIVAGSGLGALALVGVVVTVTLSAGSGHSAAAKGTVKRQVVGPATPAANSSQVPASEAAADDTAVVTYFKAKDTKIADHVQRVSRDGQFFRVYTNYPEADANSTSAISLCDWTSQYLKDQGDSNTFVFVHGTSSDNGSVVLANKVSPTDSCKVDETK